MRSFAATIVAGIAIAGCSGSNPTLTPQPSSSTKPITPTATPAAATPTPTAAPGVTATPTATPVVTPTPTAAPSGTTPTPTPTPTASPTAGSAITVTTNNPFNSMAISFPEPGGSSGCPSSDDTQTFTASESGYSGTFTAVSNDTAAVTVSPAMSSSMFTATDTNSSDANPVTITVQDKLGNSATVTVSFNEVCL